MKQTAKKKPRVFRTLVRLNHTGKKPALANGQASVAKAGKAKKLPGQPPSFFGR